MELVRWKPDRNSRECDYCAVAFEFFRRRHHCRLCGGIFCHNCSNRFLPGELLLRWLDINRERATNNTLCQTRQLRGEAHPVVAQEQEQHRLPSKLSQLFTPFYSKFTTMQRVCTSCYMDVQAHPVSTSATVCKGAHCLEPFHLPGGVEYPGRWRNSGIANGNNRQLLPCGGRERKVYVISLQGNGLVKNSEQINLPEMFDTLDKLTRQSSPPSTNGSTSSKDITPSLGPSLGSTSDLSGIEKNTIGGSVGPNGTSTKETRHGKCRSSTSTPMQNRKKVTLHVPVSSFTSETMNSSGSANVHATMVVSTQLVGLTHRHGFDRALLQQHTIGTDAYIILLDGDSSFNSSEYIGGTGSPIACTAPHLWKAVPSRPASFEVPRDSGTVFPAMAEPTHCATCYHAHYGRMTETVRSLLDAISLYGGAVPICAVVERTPSKRMDGAGAAACVAPMGTSRSISSSCNSNIHNHYQQNKGTFYLQFQKDSHEPQVSSEAHADVLQRALLLVVSEVLRREMLRCEE